LNNLCKLFRELQALPSEIEWVEFKCNWAKPEDIGEYLSALSNAAALHRKEKGYLIWGVDDLAHQVVGTRFKPRQTKKSNEELENWLVRLLQPSLDFRIHEFTCDSQPVVIFEVPAALYMPTRFSGEEFIRVGSYKAILYAPKKLADMDQQDHIRACYQHACLCWVSNKAMTNATLRERYGIEARNYPMASRIIAETIRTGLVKPADPTNKSRKQAKYVPFWL